MAIGAAGLAVPFFEALFWWDLLDPVAHAKRARVVSVQPRPTVLDLAGPVARVRAGIAFWEQFLRDSEEHDQELPPTRPLRAIVMDGVFAQQGGTGRSFGSL